LWDALGTDWLVLDAELMPWSAKAVGLMRDTFARTANAGMVTLAAVQENLRLTADRTIEVAAAKGVPSAAGSVAEIVSRLEDRAVALDRFRDTYRRYCWPADSVDDLRIAVFHVLAGEGQVYTDLDQPGHLELADRLVAADPTRLLQSTERLRVPLSPDDESAFDDAVRRATSWWQRLLDGGGEGMVVKPIAWDTRGRRGLTQPAIKVRGPEYLRIIYGPEYLLELKRLRRRGVRRKQQLAMQEYALGMEALDRFVAGEPLYRVHECVFGLLALEQEPTDPRL